MKTIEDIADDLMTEIEVNGTIAFAGVSRVPSEREMYRVLVAKAIEADRAQRSPKARYSVFGSAVIDSTSGKRALFPSKFDANEAFDAIVSGDLGRDDFDWEENAGESESGQLVHVRCGTRVSDLNVTPEYFAVCAECDEDVYRFEVRHDTRREFTEGELDDLLTEWDEWSGDVAGFYQKWTAKINREGGVVKSPTWPDGCPPTLTELPNGDNVPGHVDCSKAQRAADIAILADAAASWAASLTDNIESMREDDEDRVTDAEERDAIQAALGRYLDELESAQDVRECSRCGDEVQYLNSYDECDGCELGK